MASVLKKTGIRLELLTDINMLLMIEEGIRGGGGAFIRRYKNMLKQTKNR